MSLLDLTYAGYVNLDHRPDRRAKMEESLAKVGIKAARHRGMLPSEYKGSPDQIRAMWDRPQKGAIGCHFSQMGVISKAGLQGKHALVMEDDLVFCSDFRSRLDEIGAFLNGRAWDIFWLGGTFHVNPPHWHINSKRGCQPLGRDAERVAGHPRFVRTFGCFCTYAYIVNYKSIVKLEMLVQEKLPMSIGIDHLMIMLQPQLKTFAYVPGSVKQYDHTSDIGVGSDGGPGFTRFSTFATLNKICKCPSPDSCAHAAENLRRSAYWWQNRASDFDPDKFNWHEATT